MRRAWLLLLLACGPVDLPLVTDGGTGKCRSNGDCGADAFCERAACGDLEGTCVARPPVCTTSESRPECGCDGVVYWNSCLRRFSGASFASRDVFCQQPRRCSVDGDCGFGAWCAHIVHPDECGLPTQGACYVLPDTCADAFPQFRPCDNRLQCLPACDALSSGRQLIPAMGPDRCR